jgi:hypothetical protein
VLAQYSIDKIDNCNQHIKTSIIAETILAVDPNPQNRPQVLYAGKDIFNTCTSPDLSAIILEKWNIIFKSVVDHSKLEDECLCKTPQHILDKKNRYINGLALLASQLPAIKLKNRLKSVTNTFSNIPGPDIKCLLYSKCNPLPVYPKRIPLKQGITAPGDISEFGSYVSQAFQTPLGSIEIRVRFRHNCNFQIVEPSPYAQLPIIKHHILNSTDFVIVNLTREKSEIKLNKSGNTKLISQSNVTKPLHFESTIQPISSFKNSNGDNTNDHLLAYSTATELDYTKRELLASKSAKKFHSSFKKRETYHKIPPSPQRLEACSSQSVFRLHRDDDKDLTTFINKVSSAMLKSQPTNPSNSIENSTNDIIERSFKLLDSYGSLAASKFFEFSK